MHSLIKQHLLRAQARMEVQADKHRLERSFAVGNWVYLKLQPYVQSSLLPDPTRSWPSNTLVLSVCLLVLAQLHISWSCHHLLLSIQCFTYLSSNNLQGLPRFLRLYLMTLLHFKSLKQFCRGVGQKPTNLSSKC
jgi:hypothetical protein